MNTKEKTIEDILLEGQNKGEVRDDIDNKTLALIVMGSLRFMVKQADLRNKHENLKKESQKLIDGLRLILKK